MRICFGLLAAAYTTALASPSLSTPPVDDMQIRIFIDHRDQWLLLRTLDLDIMCVDPNHVDIISNPRQLDTIHQVGFKTETIHESVSEFYRSRLPEKDMGGHWTRYMLIWTGSGRIIRTSFRPVSQSEHPLRVATSGR